MKIRSAILVVLLLGGCEQAMEVDVPPDQSGDAIAENLRLGGPTIQSASASLDGTAFGNAARNVDLEALGRVLFYERELSRDRSISCASCHRQTDGFADPNRFSAGIDGALTTRQAMSVANVATYPNGRMFWDERAASLEEQALIPIQNPDEMGLDLNEAISRMEALPYYATLFEDAFGTSDISTERVAEALAAFQRSIITRNTRWDAWLAAGGTTGNGGNGGRGNGQNGIAGGPPAGRPGLDGDRGQGRRGDGQQGVTRGPGNGGNLPGNGRGNGPGENGPGGNGNTGNANAGNGTRGNGPDLETGLGILTRLEDQGRRLFFSNRTQCGTCHSGPDLVGDRPRNNGLDVSTGPDQGAGRGRFKMASLRNIELTAPYMHDGRFATLREVIDHYDSGVQPHPALDNRLRDNQGRPRRLNLSEQEKASLIAFLRTLTDESLALDERFSDPFVR